MPLLKKGVLLPVKGTDFSVPSSFVDDRNGFAYNLRYDKGLLRKRPGKTQQGAQTPDSDQITGYGVLETSDGSKYLLRSSKRKIQALNTGTGVWTTISIISYAGGDNDFFDFANVPASNLIISTNYVNAMYKWTGSGNQALLGGTPPKAKYLTYLSPYVLAAFTDDGVSVEPWRVAWCGTGTPEVWSGGNSGEAILDDEPSVIQNIKKLNEFAAVYKKSSLYIGRKVDAPDIFRFDCIKTGLGLAAPRCIADAGNHYFMSENDFHVWNGLRVDDIGAPVREHIFSRINRANLNRCFAVHVQTLYEIWFFIAVSSDSWPTEVWKYNYKLGFWYQDTCDGITAGVKWENTNVTTWDAAIGTWDQAQISWDEASQSQNAEQIMLGNSLGLSAYVDYSTTNDFGVPVSARFESKDFVAETMERSERWLQLDVWAKGPGKLYIDYSDDYGDSWTNIPYQAAQSYIELDGTMRKYEMYFDVWAEHVRFRFRNEEDSETFYLKGFYAWYLNREEVRSYRSA